jgi:hypothetical protein
MPDIDVVVRHYDATVQKMQTTFGPDPDSTINKALERLAPLDYSLDIAWQQRTQAFVDRLLGYGDPSPSNLERLRTRPDFISAFMQGGDALARVWQRYTQEVMEVVVNRFERTELRQRLREWLLEADTFTEHPDADAVAGRGAPLLEALARCYDMASERAETRDLRPDLLAITQWVRARMRNIELGQRSRKEAVSVPHQMYLELRSAITQSTAQTREAVRKAAEKDATDDPTVDPAASVDEWDNRLQEMTDNFARDANNRYVHDPYSFWNDWALSILREYDDPSGVVPLLKSRDFEAQIKALYRTINGNKEARDYVLKVREAAWPVQATIDHYLRGMAANEGLNRERARRDRDALTCALCVLSDRVLKEVNLIILERLVDRRGAVVEGDE